MQIVKRYSPELIEDNMLNNSSADGATVIELPPNIFLPNSVVVDDSEEITVRSPAVAPITQRNLDYQRKASGAVNPYFVTTFEGSCPSVSNVNPFALISHTSERSRSNTASMDSINNIKTQKDIQSFNGSTISLISSIKKTSVGASPVLDSNKHKTWSTASTATLSSR